MSQPHLQIRVALLTDHVAKGWMDGDMYLAYNVMLHYCDWGTGIWHGSADKLAALVGGRWSKSTAKRVLKRLCLGRYVTSHYVPKQMGNYDYSINNFIPTTGENKGKKLRRTKTRDYRIRLASEPLEGFPTEPLDGEKGISSEPLRRVFARHPKTQFVVLHVGNFGENLANVAQNLDRFPNMTIDIAARIGELGRQPRTARKFFDKYQDRILFGTDATPHGDEFPQQVFNDQLYEIYYRFLETDDEYFDYAPAKIPPQGRWRIYGIHLPETVLRKVYLENAARQLRVTV
jgi:hypothetical protein